MNPKVRFVLDPGDQVRMVIEHSGGTSVYVYIKGNWMPANAASQGAMTIHLRRVAEHG